MSRSSTGRTPRRATTSWARKAYNANFPSNLDSKVLVKKRDGVSQASALAAVKQAAQAYPGVKVLDRGQYKAEQTKFLNQLLDLVYALLGLAIIIALLGIANTLALSIAERTREVGCCARSA